MENYSKRSMNLSSGFAESTTFQVSTFARPDYRDGQK